MNKKILALAIATIMLFAVGCSPADVGTGGNALGEKFVLKAVVKNTDTKGQLEVEVIESDYAEGIYWVHTSDAKFVDAEGKSISVNDVNVGDTVKITYGGQVMMSYPPQIVAYKIEKH